MVKFQVGRTYTCRSIGDHNCTWSFTIKSRTEKTITTECGKTFRIIEKMSVSFGCEKVFPLGRYSMCPVLSAS